MTKAAPLFANFNSGELSPLLAGRADFDKFPNGASKLLNFIPTTQGPHVRRGGTVFAGQTKNNTRALLLPFEYSTTQAYVCEFGHQYVRFWTWDAATKVRGLLSVGGVPVEVATPYTLTELYNADGTPALRFAQAGDFMYLCHANHQPRLLKRTTATSFVLELYEAKGGPWQPLNSTEITVKASAETGSVTLTASANIFKAGHVGALFMLESADISGMKPWEVSKAVVLNDRRRSDGKNYKALNAGTTGSNRPVHSEGALFDGDSGVQWEYMDAGYGWGRITAVTSGTTATMTVVDRLPIDVTGTATTKRWQFGEWCPEFGWPTQVCFFRERLWFGRKQKVWGSVSADFSDFSNRAFGEVTDDMAISLELSSGRINDIQWMMPDRDLVVGTAGGEFGIGELSNGDALSPSNRRVAVLGQIGSRAIPPIKNGEALFFITRSGLKARETYYDFGSDGYKSTDLTVLAEHISRTGITQAAFCADPDQVVWCTREDGMLVGLTWNNEQSVRGWHPHSIGGGQVKDICTIPAAEGTHDELWLCVKRKVNGVDVHYVEYMSRPYTEGDNSHKQIYSDCASVYAGMAAQRVTGLTHLNGCEVSVLTDGAPHPNVTVDASGGIDLQLKASTVVIGLPYESFWRSMPIEAGARNGTAQGKTKRIHRCIYRFYNTGSATAWTGLDDDQKERIGFRKPSDAMSRAVPLFTGDQIVSWSGGYDTTGYMALLVDQPVACTLVAVLPQVDTQDAR